MIFAVASALLLIADPQPSQSTAQKITDALLEIGNVSFCRAFLPAAQVEAVRRQVYDAPTSTEAARKLREMAVAVFESGALSAARKPPTAEMCRAIFDADAH